MAVNKATTTKDLTAPAESDAKVDGPKYHKVKSPTGAVSEVPEGILDALLDSGYSKTN